ncbi:MAG: hypothetical protein ACTS27_08685 [Phycisphaerales bacterium]
MTTAFRSRCAPLAAAAALSACAAAQPLTSPGAITDPPAAPQRVSALPRGLANYAGAVVSMRDELENFPVDVSLFGGAFAPPFSVLGPEGFEWGENRLRAQYLPFGRLADLSGAPVGGPNGVVNASRAIHIHTETAQTPGGFFLGGRLEFPFDLRATTSESVDVSAEYFVESLSEMYSFENAAGRLLWGGTCVKDEPGDCADIGLPVGPILTMHSLDDPTGHFPRFFQARYCTTESGATVPGCVPHPGFNIGDPVPPPIGNWFRVRIAVNPDLTLDFRMDRLDGAGETLISRQPARFSTTMAHAAANTAFEHLDADAYVDNVTATGALIIAAEPPPFECPYLDNIDWLFEGPLEGNSQNRWFITPPAEPEVVQQGIGTPDNHALREENTIGDDVYREVFRSPLPFTFPDPNTETVFSVDLRTTGPGTTRAVALYSNSSLAARVFLGYHDPDAGVFRRNVLVQTVQTLNPATVPIRPGFGIVDTGFEFLNSPSVYQKLIIRISSAFTLTVLVDQGNGPIPIYIGRTSNPIAFNTVRFESSNASNGVGARFYVDNVEVRCDQPYFCPGDANDDGVVNFADLNTLLTNFGLFFPGIGGDTNGDNTVDFLDLNNVLTAFGADCFAN